MTEKRTATKVNKWESPDGAKTRWYLTFADGSEAVTFDSKVAEAIPIGEETDYEMQPPKQEGWKPSVSWLPSILGAKPQRGGGGPGRAPRDEAFIQERMDRRTALMQAVQWFGTNPEIGIDSVLTVADYMYEWLRSPALPKSQAAQDSDQKAGVAVAPFGEDQTRPSTSSRAVPPAYTAPSGSKPSETSIERDTHYPNEKGVVAHNVDASGPPPLDTGTGELAAAQGVTQDVAELGTTGEGVSGSAAPTEPNNDPLWPAQCCEEHSAIMPFSLMVQFHRDMVEKAVAGKQLTVRSRALAKWHLDKAKAS